MYIYIYIYTYIYIVLHIELECVLTTLCELLEWEIYFKSVTYLFYSKKRKTPFLREFTVHFFLLTEILELHALNFQHAMALNFFTMIKPLDSFNYLFLSRLGTKTRERGC